MEVLTAEILTVFALMMELTVSLATIGISPTEISDSLQSIFGVAGNKISLPCNISAPSDDDSVALVLWYKDDSTSPYYSVDARRGSLSQARHASSNAVSNRAYFSITNRPGMLQLDPLLEEDEGFYRCRVDFRKGRTRNSDVVLTVIVPPNKPIITDHSGEIQQSLIGPYNEGDRLVLVCESEGGKPLPVVTWWRESVLLDDSYDVSPLGIVRNELELSSLQRHDLMAVYTCQASNNNFSHPSSTSVTVDMNFPPVEVEIEGDRNPLSSGKTTQVICKVVGSRPPAVISWWLDKEQLKQSRESISVDGYVTSSILTFTPSSDDNNSELTCRAHNTYIPSSILQDVWKLDIHYSPKVSLRIGSNVSRSQIYEGNDIYLECHVTSNPPARDIEWEFEGEQLKHNATRGIVIGNHSLIIQKTQKKHKGTYKCLASNSEGNGESNTVLLRVLYAPYCKQSQKIIYGAAKHEAIQITCDVEADPEQVKFRWEFNNTVENSELVNFRAEGTKSVATYVLRSQYDYGTLICWARNEVGNQREPCVYTVVPAGPPDPVENCTISNQTQHAIYVECQPGYNWGLKQHFGLEIHDTGFQRLIVNITSEKPSFHLRDLPADIPFIFVIYAINNKGRSQTVTLTVSALHNEGQVTVTGTWTLTLHPSAIIICCAVVGLVVMVIIILILAKFRKVIYVKINQSKRRNSKEPQEDDKLSLHQSLAEEKCPDLISDRKFQNEGDQILDTTLLQSAFSRSRSSDISTVPEEKEPEDVGQCIRHTCEYSPGTELSRMAISRITPTVFKLQTEV